MRSRYEGTASLSVKDNKWPTLSATENHQHQHQHWLQCFSLQHQIWCKARLELHTVVGGIILSYPGYQKGRWLQCSSCNYNYLHIVMCFFPGLYNTIVMHYSSNFKFIIVVYFVSVPWIIPVKWCVTVSEKHQHQSSGFSQQTILVF